MVVVDCPQNAERLATCLGSAAAGAVDAYLRGEVRIPRIQRRNTLQYHKHGVTRLQPDRAG